MQFKKIQIKSQVFF